MRRIPWLVLLAAALVASPTRAGQVRITLNNSSFTPNDVALNAGDHVVWVWSSGVHNVESGTAPVHDGRFQSGPQSGTGPLSGGGTSFTWRSAIAGDQNYFCYPHRAFMTGVLRIANSGVPVSDFRITEVQYGAAAGQDRIEITNLGDTAGNLGRYRISISDDAGDLDIVPLADVLVASGGRVTIHTNQAGTSTATDLYMNGIGDLPTTGSVALYAPYRQSASTPGPLTADLIIDFVQWDAASQPNSSQASAFWPPAEFVDGSPQPQHSISFCGNRVQRGPSFWSVTTPNFNNPGDNCATPTTNTSWGRIKTLYR